MIVTPSGNGLLHRRGGKVYVHFANDTYIKGRWTLDTPKFDGKFWLERKGRIFTGKFGEKPDAEPHRRWNGNRVR